MIETIIKRDGRKEDFSPSKINKWGEWASKSLGNRVDWSSVVLHTVSTLPKECTANTLQERLIKTCLEYNSWSYNRMAGRLYAALIYKTLFDGTIPTVKEMHRELHSVGLMEYLDYSDEEYAQVEKIIDHSADLKASHYELKQVREKYAIRNRITGKEYESQQFVYMRMAMALAEDQPKDRRMNDLERWYSHFSEKRINAPTPNYVNLGTPLRGFASCCLYTVNDNARSIGIGDHIAYTMTYMSAGIGAHHQIRSIGDSVKGGIIKHLGKLGYYRSLVGAIKANLQNGRGGAAATYYNMFDPEVEIITRLKNPMSTEDKKIRGMDYSAGGNKFFARKAAKNEDIFLFNCFTAPDLYDAFYSEDIDLFERLYEKYENDKNFKKQYVNAREIILTSLNEAFETGRSYLHWVDEINRHTPFKEKIYSSNLCFTGDTLVATADGRNAVTIKELASESNNENKFPVYSARKSRGQRVDKKWVTEIKDAVAFHTGHKEVVEVTLSDGSYFRCTDDHRLALANGEYIEAKDSIRSQLQSFFAGNIYVVDVKYNGEKEDVYDLTVEDNENFYIITDTKDNNYLQCSGVLVHNCSEVTLATKGYDNMSDLYSYEDHGKGEVAVCSLGGIVVGNIKDDAEYEEVAYYTLLMIDKCIHRTHYELPHIGVTAKARLSAGVGIIGLAHYMAKKGLRYSSKEGKQEIHRLSERHMYHMTKASLQLGKELGNAPWIHKTKWPEGWLPIDTYNKNVDKVVDNDLQYDWEELRRDIIANKGIRNTVVVAHMPSESCLHKDQKIKTSTGLMSMEQIFSKTGYDLDAAILDYDKFHGGKWYELEEPIQAHTRHGLKPVNRIWYNGHVNYITLTMENGDEIKCTHHHKFLVKDENGVESWKMAINLDKNDDIVQYNS